MNILVVDDNSPDGTGDVVEQLQLEYANLQMIQGEKSGLGAAYVRGISHALEALRSDVIFEMDADFSHKPEDVPRLLSEIEAGADFVIGSRYVKGGSIPKEWGLVRCLNSLGGNIAARYIAGILQVKDCTAGFRAIRASLLRRIDLTNLRVQGYVFQIALLHAALMENARIKEIPVDFIDRQQGESKLGFSDIVEFLVNVWWIRFERLETFIKFAIVGTMGVIVNLGFFSAFLAMGLNKYIASPIAIELSIVSNFIINNYWTFGLRRTKDRIRIKGLKFNIVSFVTFALSWGSFVGLTSAFPETAPQVHQLIGIVPGTVVNYFLNSYWTFRHIPKAQSDSEDIAVGFVAYHKDK
jgi:dolichol-phosphate mannosyltransferase